MSEIKVNSIKGVGASAAAITVNNTDGTCTANITNYTKHNYLINGNFHCWQRGTSQTADGYGSVDRWYLNLSGGAGTVSRQTFAGADIIDGSKYYTNMNMTTGNDYCTIRQKIEDVTSIPAGSVTVSFYAKFTSAQPTGGIAVQLVQNFGSGGSSDVLITEQSITATTSWARYEMTFTIPSLSGKTIGANSHLLFVIGQNTTSGTSAFNIDLANIQLEVGTKASGFEIRSFGQELALCQRYCCIFSDTSGYGFYADYDAPSVFTANISLPVEMRVEPTITQTGSGGTNNSGFIYSNLQGDPIFTAVGRYTINAHHSVVSAGRAYMYMGNSAELTMEAEL